MESAIRNIEVLTFEDICGIISNIYNSKKLIQLEDLERLFVRFTEQLFMGVFKIDRAPNVQIVDDKKNAGSYNGYITIKIDRQLLKQFQEGKALELFEIICHEFHHVTQKREYQNISKKNSIIEKDSYLANNIVNYYGTNYDALMVEVDAFLMQSIDADNILAALRITPSEEELRLSNERREEVLKCMTITNRFIGEEILDLDEIFDRTLSSNTSSMDECDRTSFFEFRPCIALEYKIVDGKFVRKTSKEIEQLYNDWVSGTIQLQGVEDEIDTYFQYTIAKVKNSESNLEDKFHR